MKEKSHDMGHGSCPRREGGAPRIDGGESDSSPPHTHTTNTLQHTHTHPTPPTGPLQPPCAGEQKQAKSCKFAENPQSASCAGAAVAAVAAAGDEPFRSLDKSKELALGKRPPSLRQAGTKCRVQSAGRFTRGPGSPGHTACLQRCGYERSPAPKVALVR